MSGDEAERLAALRRLEILDTDPEAGFDDIVNLAAYVCGTPMAAVSLVDEHRQWFKARLGLPVVETPRAEAFCTHTIAQRDVFEVADAASDPRFAHNMLVRGDLRVRFYAASPLLTSEDMAIGTLCVLDRVPRRLDADQRTALKALADQAMAQIVLRQQLVATQRLEERFRAVVEQSSDLIALVDAEGVLRYISPAVRHVLGYEPDDPGIRMAGAILNDPAARDMILAAVASEPGARMRPVEIPARRKDGTTAHLEVRASNLLADPAVRAVVFNCRDVTERHQAQADLEQARLQAVLVLETANDAYIQMDAAGLVTEWNRRAASVFGWTRDEAIGIAVADLIVPPRYRAAHNGGVVSAALRTDRAGETIFDGLEVTAMRRDGTEFPVEVTLWSTARSGGGIWFSAFVRDITERRLLEERLAHHAFHDDLTGLPNRHLLKDRLEGALARAGRDGRHVGVLFCDLDRFKVVNDGRGHSVGDAVLSQVAKRLVSAVRSVDTVVRFGGDEFVVIVDGVDDGIEVSMVAERIRAAVSEPLTVDQFEVPTTVSIGVVVSNGNANAEQMVSDADAAMYLAKERGRDRIEAFGDELRHRVRARLDDEQALRRALEENEFRVLYQPIVSLDEGTVFGAEALVRWERPGHGLVAPSAFIPLAEETGLILALGTWVLGEACAQLRAWQDAYPDRRLGVSVNVSARQVASGDLDKVVADAIQRSDVEPGSVTLELTESTLMEDLGQSSATLTGLQRTGVHLAIDDFGTGYSSLAYLKALPIDTLKVDRSFVANLGTDPYDSAIVAAITTIARSLFLRVVAEGVETSAQAEQVRAHGCDFAQGYHFSRPLDADAFMERLAEDQP